MIAGVRSGLAGGELALGFQPVAARVAGQALFDAPTVVEVGGAGDRIGGHFGAAGLGAGAIPRRERPFWRLSSRPFSQPERLGVADSVVFFAVFFAAIIVGRFVGGEAHTVPRPW